MVFVFVFVSVCLFAFCLFYVSLHQKNVTLKFQYIFQVLTGSEEIIYNTVRETLKVPNCQFERSAICIHFVQEPSTRHQNPVIRSTLHKNPPFVKRRGLDFICSSRSDHCACFRPSEYVSGGLVYQNDFLLVRDFFWLRELVKPTSCLKRKVVVLDESADVAAFFDFQDLAKKNVRSELSEPLQRLSRYYISQLLRAL